jgi:crotonobetainyl-CoA:carnitine CoA-transferase CaiB-like acyl-CoA transferase
VPAGSPLGPSWKVPRDGALDALTELPYDRDSTLSGTVVVEAGEGISVAFCGRVLADLGATVIKIEHPDGDPLRHGDPPHMDPPDGFPSLHAHLNRGKLSVALDLDAQSGRTGFADLSGAATAVVGWCEVEKPVLLATLDEVAEAHPELVVVALSWMGTEGPWRGFACDELLAQHMSGMAFSTGVRVTDTALEPPLASPGGLAQMMGGLTAATAVVLSCVGREATGVGDFVDVSLVDALVSCLRQEVVTSTYGVGLMSRKREAVSRFAGVFQQPAGDGDVDFMIRTEAMWRAVLETVGTPDWGNLEAFASHPDRSLHWDAVEPLLQADLARYSRQYLFHEGQRRGVAVAPVNTVAEATREAVFASRQFFREGEVPGFGPAAMPGGPFRLDRTAEARGGLAALGRDNETALRWANRATDGARDGIAR